MCTALSFHGLFGRTLDLEWSLDEQVVVTPRHFPLPMRHLPGLNDHYAIIGMAHVEAGSPLYYDGMNEHGLAMAGLNFPHSAHYPPLCPGRNNVAPFELIPWVLAQCADLTQARQLLAGANVAAVDFSPQLPRTPMHWLISDRTGRCLAVEPLEGGLHLSDNPVGVLTNEPELSIQLLRLNEYMSLSPLPPENRFSSRLPLSPHSRGTGALGLPGDFSSPSRFVRAAFLAHNARPGTGEATINQFFHIMDSVAVVEGCVRVSDGDVRTIYTSCCDTQQLVYHYTTYENRAITAIPLRAADGSELVCHPLIRP